MKYASHRQHGARQPATVYRGGYAPPPVRKAVSYRTVPCPDCPAGIGEACVGITGTHTARKRLATRRYNEDRETREAGELGPYVTDDPALGGVCPTCRRRILFASDGTLVRHTTRGGSPRPTKGRYACLGSGGAPLPEPR